MSTIPTIVPFACREHEKIMLTAFKVVWLASRPVLVIPGSSITPPPNTLRSLICSPNIRVLSGEGCQEVIGGLVRYGCKVSLARGIGLTEAASFIPGLFCGMIFVALSSVRKMCPSFRTSYIIENSRCSDFNKMLFTFCYCGSSWRC